jgi:flagellar hook-associated protein 3 FlgL
MRITHLTTFNRLQQYLSKNRKALAKYQNQLITKKRVTKASDDSVAFSNSRHLENFIRRNEQYQDNISSGLSKARSAENALGKMQDILSDFKTLALSGATDTKDAHDRKLLANQVESMKKKLVDLANSKFNGSYLFSGTKTDQTPFSINSTTGDVNYAGNGSPMETQISDISNVSVSVTGKDLRTTKEGDLFDIMNVVKTDLQNNDVKAIKNHLDQIDTTFNHVTSLSAKLGNHINRMKFLNDQHKSHEIDQKGRVSELVDTDYSKAILNLQKHELSYQAALEVHSKIVNMSLMNYLQ